MKNDTTVEKTLLMNEPEAKTLMDKLLPILKELDLPYHSAKWTFLYDIAHDDLIIGFVCDNGFDGEYQIDAYGADSGFIFHYWKRQYHLCEIQIKSDGTVIKVIKD